jgi:hypothetical protein
MIYNIAFIAALFSATANAQTECPPNFQACKDIIDQFKTSTCLPMLAQNQTQYQVCLCHYDVRYVQCYDQCPGVTQIQTERIIYQGRANADCAVVGLSPNNLGPAPWVKDTTPTMTPSANNVAPTTTPTGSTSNTDNKNVVKNSATKLVGSLGVLAAVTFLL